MTNLHKLRTPSILKWVSSNFVDSNKNPSWPTGSLFHIIAKNPRYYRTKRIVEAENSGQRITQISRAAKKEAQGALLDYLHCTRSLQFTDAVNMSANSPHFLENLLQKVDIEGDIQTSIARFLRYHPINEFELFFESLGLKPHEYSPFLPRDLMFLSDDNLMVQNYHVLCNYGIARNKIGRIYKVATELFRYDDGVLESKFEAYGQMGLGQSLVAKMVVCSPYLLIGDVNIDFIKVLEILRKGGIEVSWIEENLSEEACYNWSKLLELLNLFRMMGYSEEQLGGLISQHPGILFEGSGDRTLLLIGFLLKFGCTMNQICSVFLQFPQIEVGKFIFNMRQCLFFLNEIEMEVHEIGRIVHSDPLLLGSCNLKKANTLLTNLNVGKKRLCQFIKENPQEMRKWVMGSKVEPLEKPGRALRSKMLKTKFLLELGFVENSVKMERALKCFRGKAAELPERFDCFLKAGLDRKDVCEMVTIAPHVLNQTKDVIEMKMDFLVNGLGYPVSSLVTFPSYLSYTIERVRLRFAMYNWLKDQGTADQMLPLSTLIAFSDKMFVRKFVKHHPGGPEVWQDLKKKIYSEQKL